MIKYFLCFISTYILCITRIAGTDTNANKQEWHSRSSYFAQFYKNWTTFTFDTKMTGVNYLNLFIV